MRMQIVRYILVGGFTHLINIAVFALLYKGFGVWYIYATITSGTIAWMVNFPLHRGWTFNDRRGAAATTVQGTAHASLKVWNIYVWDPYLLFLAVEKMFLDPLVGKIVIGVGLGLQNFIVCRYLIFKKPAQ